MITKKQKRKIANFIRNEGIGNFCQYNESFIDSIQDAEFQSLVRRFFSLEKKFMDLIDYEQSLKEHDRIQEKNSPQKAAAVPPPAVGPVDGIFPDEPIKLNPYVPDEVYASPLGPRPVGKSK